MRSATERKTTCFTCSTSLIWVEESNEYYMKVRDHHLTNKGRCGNGWSGFTNKLLIDELLSGPNDIKWWLDDQVR